MKLYLSASIRGTDGEFATEYIQKHNILLACQHVQQLRKYYPEITWVCPHENEMINEMVFCGAMDSDDLILSECYYISHGSIDGVVVVGKYIPDSGCGKEVLAAHESHKFCCFMDDTGRESREHFEVMLSEWESQ